MSSEVVAYLSHARVDDKLSEFARDLVSSLGTMGGTLRNDTDDGLYTGPVNEFMAELATATAVVFLLNDRFLQSKWCMSELTGYLFYTEYPQYHAIFIRTEGWLDGEVDIGASLRGAIGDSVRDYWRGEVNAETDSKDKERANFIATNVKSAFTKISNQILLTETLALEGDQTYQSLYEEIEGKCNHQRASFDVSSHETFNKLRRRSLIQVLDRDHTGLKAELALALPDTATDNQSTENLVDELFALIYVRQLNVARNALRHYVSTLVTADQNHLGWLCEFVGLMLLGCLRPISSDDFRDTHEKDQLKLADDHPLAADLLVSRLLMIDRMSTTPRFLEWSSKKGFVTPGGYGVVQKDSDPEGIVAAQIHEIWSNEFGGRYGKEPDIKRLRSQMETNFYEGNPRYLLVPSGSKSSIRIPGILSGLKRDLPYLFPICLTGDASDIEVISSSMDGKDIFMDQELDGFEVIIKRLNKQ